MAALLLLGTGCRLLLPPAVPDPIPAPTPRGSVAATPPQAAMAIMTPTPTPSPSPTAIPTVLTPRPTHPSETALPLTPPPFELGDLLEEEVTITLWHAFSPSSEPGVILAALLRDLAYDGVTVETRYLEGEEALHRELLLAIERGQPPDLAVVPPDAVAEYIRLGAVIPIEKEMEDAVLGLSADDLADMRSAALDLGYYPQYDGYYALPFAQHALALYANLDLLSEAGYERPPETCVEFEEMAQKVSKVTGKLGYAIVPSGAVFDAWLLACGGEQLSEEYDQVLFDQEAGRRALEMLTELCSSGAAEVVAEDRALYEFALGNVAMILASTADVDQVERLAMASNTRWVMAPLPQDQGGRGTVLGGQVFALFGTPSPRRTASWLVARYLSDGPHSARWAQAGYLPLRTSAIPAGEQIQLAAIAAQAVPEPRVRCEQEIRDYLSEAMVVSIEQLLTPEEALTSAAGQVRRLLLSDRQ